MAYMATTANPANAMYAAAGTPGTVLCCMCGANIAPNPANMCANCIRSQVDITEGIQKQCTVLWCKECNRWLNPPKAWVRAELESKELLTFCVKKVKGLSKVKLVDAGFIWTEPHSRRLKLKLTIQAEVLNGAILQQTFVVEFVVEPHMCEQCQRSNTNSEVWTACVQIRQKVEHKRTFLFLEQLILKHGAEVNSVGVKEAPDGLDFFYGSRSHALKLLDFLSAVVAVRSRADKQLVSADHSSNLYTYKHTFAVEIVPLCKEDLVMLPRKVYSGLGALGPLLLVARVSNQLTLLDPTTLRTAAVDATAYWRCPYRPVAVAKQLQEFVVLDIEASGPPVGRYTPAEASVVRQRDWGGGRGDAVLFARTHLGGVLKPGDVVLGYDVAGATLAGAEAEEYRGLQLPDVVLVRKSYAERRRARRERQGAGLGAPGAPGGRGTARRAWKLRRLAVAPADTEAVNARRGAAAAAAASGIDDEEAFLEELEEDPELRARVALYRDRNAPPPLPRQRDAMNDGGSADDEDDSDDDFPEVPLEELLEEMSLGGAPSDMEDEEAE